MRRLFILIFLLYAASGPARAESPFIDALGDVPAMPALHILPERTLVFDKPEGRIAQVTALAGEGVQTAQLEGFYAQSLPQLGWRAATPGAYVREGQKLTISPGREDGRLLVILRVEPQ